jgi:hypothetical protein
MMQTRLLLLLPLLGFFGNLQAQCPGCVIDLPGNFPADTIYLGPAPDGEAGAYYNQDISFRMPMSTTPVSAIDPTTPPGLPISSIQIVSVGNLPPGVNWEASKLDFNVGAGDTDGCVKFCGTPVISDTFFVQVTVNANVFGIVQSSSFTLPLYIAPSSVVNQGFGMINNIGCGSATVSFINNIPSNGMNGFSYWWDFGNGNVSNLENPGPQTYSQAGEYAVQYNAVIDTIGHILTGVTILETDCSDFNLPPFNKPDLYIVVKNPSGVTIYTSPVVDNATVPYTFAVNINLQDGNYTIDVYDEETLFGPEYCGTVNFTKNTTGILSSGALKVSLNIINPIVTVNTTDYVQVYAIPDAPILDYDATTACDGTPILLEAVNYAEGIVWLLDGLVIPGAADPAYEALESGSYWAVYTSPDGCTANSGSVDLTFIPLPNAPIFTLNDNLLYLLNPNVLPAAWSAQWYFEGTAIPGATGLSYCMTASGEHTLGITDLATGCTNYYTQPTAFLPGVACISSTEEADLANGSLRLFPNPVQSLLNLQIGEMKAGEVEIYCLNNLGQILLQYNVAHPGGEFAFQMPAQSLPNGWYTLAIRSAEGNWTARAPFVKAD